ncbi:uncharacterized protein LOC133307389 [Gastrolobium bilobum]|uniref:uncharacterized protein LOC133307389 n=1 Tax=Gastrolobium bilobum TaxID=150636 RepID=UPI002AB2C1D4|nr:uncharacterized protein LOC133307389 [Gastrolobium bilobum]
MFTPKTGRKRKEGINIIIDYYMMHNGFNRQSTLKDKFKSSICCFTGTVHHHHHHHHDHSLDHYNKLDTPRTPLSPSSWFRKSPTSSEYGVDTPRVRGRSLRSRMGHRKHHHNRQSQSADFSYDPSSYALNFENESPENEFPIRNFSSRLPASPPTPASLPPLSYSDMLPKEIIGYI